MSSWVKPRRLLAGLALLGLLLLPACEKTSAPEAPALLEPKGVSMDVAAVERDAIWVTETYEGLVLPRVRELSFPAAGVMTGVNVCPGSRVKAGDVLASLDVSYAAAALEAQQSYLDYREETEAVSRRQQEIQIRLKELETESLRASGAESCDIRLSELRALELENALEESDALWALDRADALESLEALEDTVANSSLTAPCDGTVVACTAFDGLYAMENAGVIWLAEDADLYLSVAPVSAAVLERADEVYASVGGKRVEVELLGADESEGCRAGMSSFRVTEDPENAAESGMAAVLFVISGRTEDALVIPSSALHRDDSYFVYKVVDGVQVRQNVRCGVMNDARVQILSGLEEGDLVYAGA